MNKGSYGKIQETHNSPTYGVTHQLGVQHKHFIRNMTICRSTIKEWKNGDCDPEPNINVDRNGSLLDRLQWSLRMLYEMDIVDNGFDYENSKTWYGMGDEFKKALELTMGIKQYADYYNLILYTYFHGMPTNRKEIEEYQRSIASIIELNGIIVPKSIINFLNHIQRRLQAI